MNGPTLFYRLLWQRGTLLSLFLLAGMGLPLFGIASRLLPSLGLSDATMGLSPLAFDYLILFVTGLLSGALAAYTVRDLMHCRFTWSLPRLRSRMCSGVLSLMVLTVGSISVVLHLAGWPLGAAGLGLGMVTFGLALLLGTGDSVHARIPASPWRKLLVTSWIPGPLVVGLVCLTLLTLFVFAEQLAPWLMAHSVLGVLVGVILNLFAFGRFFDTDAIRTRALCPPSKLGSSFRPIGEIEGWEARLEKGTLAPGLWGGGPIRSISDWMRALHFENFAWQSRQAGLRLLLLVSVIVAIPVVGLGGYSGWSTEGSLKGAARSIHLIIWEPERLPADSLFMATYLLILVVVAAMLGAAAALRPDLRLGTLYPLSRTLRAEVIWRTALLRWAALVGALAAGLFAVGTLSAQLAGTSPRFDRVPEFLLVLVVAATFAPGLAWTALWLTHQMARASRTALAFVVPILAAAVFSAILAGLVNLLRDFSNGVLAALVFVVAPAAIVLGQLLLRRHVRLWMAKVNLA